jgi:hypothetical protein
MLPLFCFQATSSSMRDQIAPRKCMQLREEAVCRHFPVLTGTPYLAKTISDGWRRLYSHLLQCEARSTEQCPSRHIEKKKKKRKEEEEENLRCKTAQHKHKEESSFLAMLVTQVVGSIPNNVLCSNPLKSQADTMCCFCNRFTLFNKILVLHLSHCAETFSSIMSFTSDESHHVCVLQRGRRWRQLHTNCIVIQI